MKKKTLERRLGPLARKIEVRETAGKPATVVGYAAVYNVEAVIGGLFREKITPGAFTRAIASGCDVRALFNHDDNLVLGRTTNGTLRLSEDDFGLRYEFDPNPDDPDAAKVVAKIARGDVSGSSYGFRVADGGDIWTKASTRGELPLRTINDFELLRDVSPVTFPAFDETSAEVRSELLEVLKSGGRDDAPPAKNKTASGKVGKWYAGTDGTSFPISTAEDVHNASKDLNQTTQNKARVKANIIRIAYAHGLESGLPDAWKKAKDRPKSAIVVGEQRAQASGMAPDDAEEEAELIAYAAMLDSIADAEAHLARMRQEVEALVSDETDEDPAVGEDEDAEEEIESAHLAVVTAECSQANGAIYAVQGLAYQCLRNQDDDGDEDIYVSVYRRELEILEVG